MMEACFRLSGGYGQSPARKGRRPPGQTGEHKKRTTRHRLKALTAPLLLRKQAHECSRMLGVTRELGLMGPWDEKPWGHSSVGRAPALQAGSHGFESRCLHQRNRACSSVG